MRIIEKFEKQIGKSLEALNYNDLINAMANEKFKEYFSTPKNTLEIISELINRNNDKNFVRELYITKYSLELVQDETLIDNLFTNYKNQKIKIEDLQKGLESFRNSSDPLLVVSTFLCSIIAMPNIELKDEEMKLIENINLIKDNIFKNIDDVSSENYHIYCNIVDLIYSVREYWWNKYDADILKNIDWVDKITDKLTELEEKEIKKKKNVNIKPEDMGFIDITKLKKE